MIKKWKMVKKKERKKRYAVWWLVFNPNIHTTILNINGLITSVKGKGFPTKFQSQDMRSKI